MISTSILAIDWHSAGLKRCSLARLASKLWSMITPAAKMPELPEAAGAVGIVKRRSRSDASAAEDHVRSPDGRLCRLCHKPDSSPDPVVSSQFRKWHYAPVQGRTSGTFCYYCARVWMSRFRHKFTTLGALVTGCGADSTLFQSFLQLVSELITKCAEAGSHLPAFKRESGIQSDIHAFQGGLVQNRRSHHKHPKKNRC